MLMKKNHFFTYSKICTLALAGAGALFFTSCAKGIRRWLLSLLTKLPSHPVPTVSRRLSHGLL